MTIWIIFFLIAAYLCASVSSAILICRALGKPDPRTLGSTNPGATNVRRIAGKPAAAAVLFFDVAKGALPTYLAFLAGLPDFAIGLVAISACLGHMYPIFFQFRGGKAVATALGAMLPMGWYLAFALIATWSIVYKVSKYSSLAAVVTVSLAPFYTYYYKPQFTLEVIMLSVLIVIKHQKNIVRLMNGTELRNKQQIDTHESLPPDEPQ